MGNKGNTEVRNEKGKQEEKGKGSDSNLRHRKMVDKGENENRKARKRW